MQPTVYVNLIDGSRWTQDNPGAVRGDWLGDPNRLLEQAHVFARACGIASVTYMLPAGLHRPLGTEARDRCAFTAATGGILRRYYPRQWLWCLEDLPSLQIPEFLYGLYIGGRCARNQAQDEYCTPRDERGQNNTLIPTADFFVEGLVGLEDVFDHVVIDAMAGEPALRPHMDAADAALKKRGWTVGAEMLPHTGVASRDGFALDEETALKRPHMILARHFGVASSRQNGVGNFFARRLHKVPEGKGGPASITISPIYGDDLVTPEVVKGWLEMGLTVSPQMGFERTRPETCEVLREWYQSSNAIQRKAKS